MTRCFFLSSVFWSLCLVVFLSTLPDRLSGQKRHDPGQRSPEFLDSLRRQIAGFRQKGDEKALADHLLEVSLQYSYNANAIDSVLKWQREAQRIYRNLRDTSGLLRVNNALQSSLLLVDRTQEMAEVLRQNLHLSQHDQDTLQHIINQLGLGYYFLENPELGHQDSAHYYLAEAVATATRYRDTLHLMIAHSELGRYYLTIAPDLASAKKHLDQALFLLPHSGEEEAFTPFLQFTMGEYYQKAGQFRQALPFFHRTVDAAHQFEDWNLIAVACEKMAVCYQEIGDYEQAYEQIRQVMKWQKIIRDREQMETIQRIEAEYGLQRKNDQIALLNKEQELRQQRLQRQQQLTRAGIVFSLAVLLIAGLIIVVVLQRLRANRHKAQQEALLKKRLQDFYTNVTHELYTPLTVIQASAWDLPDSWPEKDRILRNSEQLVAWTNQLLLLSRAEAGFIQPHYIHGDLIAFLRRVAEPFRYLAKQKGLDFVLDTQSLDHFSTDFDPAKLQQILTNLLSNAIKFTRPGDAITLRLTFFAKAAQWQVDVADTGPGIAPDQQDRIFERFYQQEGRTGQGGVGIGLAVVREWIDLLGGTISVQSRVGEGTTFSLSFSHTVQAQPEHFSDYLSEPDLAWPHSLETKENSRPAGKDNPLVLIIEDHLDLVALLRKRLNNRYRIISASSGEEGLDKALSAVPDLVICDVMLGTMDGYQVTDALKNDFRTNHVPVVLLTAKNTQAEKLTGLRRGADAYMTKPFDPDELDLRIDQLIRQRQQLQLRWSVKGQAEHAYNSQQEQNLQQIHDFLEANLSREDLSVADLCRAMGVSRMQLHRKLKALTGFSTAQYIRHYRIEKAKHLLVETQIQISEIAYQVGFRDPGYFSKQFRALTNMSPSQFRSTIDSEK